MRYLVSAEFIRSSTVRTDNVHHRTSMDADLETLDNDMLVEGSGVAGRRADTTCQKKER